VLFYELGDLCRLCRDVSRLSNKSICKYMVRKLILVFFHVCLYMNIENRNAYCSW